jgi:hypothetical protein
MRPRDLPFSPPRSPPQGLSLAVTGHRSANRVFASNREEIEAAVNALFDTIDVEVRRRFSSATPAHPFQTKLHSLLVDGLDQIGAQQALDRNWSLVAPLPFGALLNAAINAAPPTFEMAQAILRGKRVRDDEVQTKIDHIKALMSQAVCFELADRDEEVSALFLAKLKAPDSLAAAQAYASTASKRVALAARVMIEQSDVLIGVWDGVSTDLVGGTGHTIELALGLGVPVLWIDAGAPQNVRLLQTPEALATRYQKDTSFNTAEDVATDLMNLVFGTDRTNISGKKRLHFDNDTALQAAAWHAESQPLWHGYRRIEAIFGAQAGQKGLAWRNLKQVYERPDQIAMNSAKEQMEASLSLPGQDGGYVSQIKANILSRFAWADGISSYLSDCYRGGMVMNFVLSALAISGGMAYLPFATSHEKWVFALFELVLLSAILSITLVGTKLRWHGRWFETRRVAEYLRTAPVLLMIGIARPLSRWPKGTQTSWPETYVRQTLRSIGLPQISITSSYLKAALVKLVLPFVEAQIEYHTAKAQRLARAHHRLDEVSGFLFKLAVLSVASYLALKLGGALQVIDEEIASHFSKLFTFLGVLLPTFGGAFAGIRYFGDFERFSSISEVTAQRFKSLRDRIHLLLSGPEGAISFDYVSDLAHTLDDVVFSEIESWQAVFSGKQISVPV